MLKEGVLEVGVRSVGAVVVYTKCHSAAVLYLSLSLFAPSGHKNPASSEGAEAATAAKAQN